VREIQKHPAVIFLKGNLGGLGYFKSASTDILTLLLGLEVEFEASLLDPCQIRVPNFDHDLFLVFGE
jgi:hypothetical protein